MKPRLLKHWERIRTSFWFLPSILLAAAVLLSFLTLAIDQAYPYEGAGLKPWLYTGSAEGAGTILGTIAGSMITIAGVVFSLTLVSLTLASSQFGPRLLRNFMRDQVNQMVIGTFTATFLYCLLILRAIRREEAGSFVPQLSVSFSLLLAIVAVGVLIYFIHHVSVSIQADEVVARVAADLMNGIDRIFPEEIGRDGAEEDYPPPDACLPDSFEQTALPLKAAADGYLQLIDQDILMELASREDVLLKVDRRPGHYIAAGITLARAWPGDRIPGNFEARLNAAFVLGNRRTPVQDVEFSLSQLVEVAVRALSPGINDPFTAVRCIDRLGSALCRLAGRKIPSPCRRDERGRIRVVAYPFTFPDILDAGFDQIRQAAISNTAVTIRLMETIALIAGFAFRSMDRSALRRQADMIIQGAREHLPLEEDRRAVEERYFNVLLRIKNTN